jgi:hypothetical protein
VTPYQPVVALGLAPMPEVLVLRLADAPWVAVLAVVTLTLLLTAGLTALALVLTMLADAKAISGGAKTVTAWAMVQKYRRRRPPHGSPRGAAAESPSGTSASRLQNGILVSVQADRRTSNEHLTGRSSATGLSDCHLHM